MEIINVPPQFTPHDSTIEYPPYNKGGGNIEQHFEQFVENKPGVKDMFLHRSYLPVRWTHFYINRKYGQEIADLNQWLDQLPRDKDYFTICQYDDGVLYKPDWMDLTVYSAGGGGGGTRNIPIPLIAEPLDFLDQHPGYFPQMNERKYLACFVGSSETHPIRGQMLEAFDGLVKQGEVMVSNKLSPLEYFRTMQNSVFTLCPRGYGKTSFRLYEAIAAGSIPVYISDEHWLPDDIMLFPEECKLIIKATPADLKHLPATLLRLRMSGAPFWWESHHNVFGERMLTYNNIANCILKHVV